MTEHRNQVRYLPCHGGSHQQWLYCWCVYLDVELREDNTSLCGQFSCVAFYVTQDDGRQLSGKSLSAQQLSYGKFRIRWLSCVVRQDTCGPASNVHNKEELERIWGIASGRRFAMQNLLEFRVCFRWLTLPSLVLAP